jgi:hypothetical protein
MSMRPFGADDDPDQVVRKQKFLAEHPEWEATFIQPAAGAGQQPAP